MKLKPILKYLKPFWKSASVSIVFNLFSVFFGLFSVAATIPLLNIIFNAQNRITEIDDYEFSVSYFMQFFQYKISNIIIADGYVKALIFIGLIIIVIIFFKTLFKYLSLHFIASIKNGVPKLIRNEIFSKILRLPMSYYSDKKKGDIIARMSADVQEVELSVVSSIQILIREPITILIYLITLFIISFKLTLFVLILLPISAIIIGRIGKDLRKTSLKGHKRIGTLLSITDETITNMRIIKAFNAEEKMQGRFESTNNFYTRLMTKMFRRRYLANPLSEFLGIIILVAIMIFGGTMVINSKGDLSSQEFMGYLMLIFLIITPAKSFSSGYYNLQKGMASIDRINQILNTKEKIYEKEEAQSISDFSEKIEYKDVSFKYDNETILNNINLTINKGQTIAIVGKSGSGKTTIADLLPRFYDCVSGDIFIDGTPIKDFKIQDLRNLIGVVNQSPLLFNDSFYNNIAFGNKKATTEDVIDAAKIANAHDFISKSKNKYYTNIGDNGNKLSGGERQRISIARAILKNPQILILDEATSSLDTESEKLVQDALHKLTENRTSIVIAHRLSTIKNADLIYVVNDGKIVEQGKHQELLEKNGYFKNLYDLQFFA